MEPNIEQIRQMIIDGRVDEAIALCDACLARDNISETDCAMLFYHRGNAYRKRGDLRMALNSYHESSSLDEHSPAVQAIRVMQDILDFYDKDRYNP